MYDLLDFLTNLALVLVICAPPKKKVGKILGAGITSLVYPPKIFFYLEYFDRKSVMDVVTANETCQRQNFPDDVIVPCTEFRLLNIVNFHTAWYGVVWEATARVKYLT